MSTSSDIVPSDGNEIALADQQNNPGFANSGIKKSSNMGVTGDSGLIIPPPKKKDLNFEIGVTYSYPFATQYHNLWEIWKTDKVTVLQLEVMRRTDGHARALYRALTLPIIAALKTSYVMPVDGQDGGQEEANFITQMLNLPPASGGMVVTLNKLMRQMLLGTFHGFSAFEMVYWVPSKGPLAGKITLKKASWRPADTVHFLTNPQNEFAGWRQRTFVNGRYIDVLLPHDTALLYTCFTGDTKVALLDGRDLPISDVVKEVQEGKDLWAYSIDDKQQIVAGKIYAGKSQGIKSVVEVALDNGKTVRCTPDHKFMLRDGTYKEAGKLTEGDSLMPLYRKDAPVGRSKKMYEQVYVPGEQKFKFTHRVVADAIYGPGKTGWVTHHKDVNDHNNNPTNLARITNEEHWALHQAMTEKASAALKEKWADPEWREEVGNAVLAKLQSPEAQAKAIASARTPERRKAQSEFMKANAKHTRRDITLEAITEAAGEFYSCAEVAEHFGVHRDTVTNKLLENGFSRSWREFRKSLGDKAASKTYSEAQLKHFEVRTKFVLEDIETLVIQGYRTVEEIASQLGISRSSVDKKIRSYGHVNWTAFKEAVLKTPANNHKVVSVVGCGEEEVFDITIDNEFHNFALSDMVFVKNCNSEESPFYGVSMFESAFWHYDKKVKLYYLAHLAAQKGAIGTRIAHMPPNPNKADKDNFLTQLNQLGVKQYMAMPTDWDVEVIQEAGKFDYISLIEHHNHMMSESILAGFMDGNATGGAQPNVNFSTQDDTLFIQMLETVMDDVADVINNQLIPRFIDWNFGTSKYPTFHWGPFTDEQRDAIRLTFNQMALAPTINMAPELWQALQTKWGKDLGINVDYDSIQGQWDQQNEQNDQLAQLQFQTNLVQQHNSLEEAANPAPPPPPVVPGAIPGVPTPKAPAVPEKAATSTPTKTVTPRAPRKVPVSKKVAAAQQTASAHKQNSGNPNPSQVSKPLSPKSAAQKDVDRAKERQRGH